MTKLLVQFVVLMVVFSFIENRWPSSRSHKWWRRPLLVDICSWFIHPLAMGAGIVLAVAATDALLAAIPDQGIWATLSVARARVAAFPTWAQLGIAVLVADFLAYWVHRAYHRFPLLWAFHVMHHSSEELDWLSTSRLHPLSQALNTAMTGVILLFLGLPVAAVIGANVIIGAAALVAHANVRWNFGPLQHLLVSPLFHQWHHAHPEHVHHDGVGNFGAIFSIWDRLFGTWRQPAQTRPVRFGVQDSPPPTLPGLIFHPVRVCIRYFQGLSRRRGPGRERLGSDGRAMAGKPAS